MSAEKLHARALENYFEDLALFEKIQSHIVLELNDAGVVPAAQVVLDRFYNHVESHNKANNYPAPDRTQYLIGKKLGGLLLIANHEDSPEGAIVRPTLRLVTPIENSVGAIQYARRDVPIANILGDTAEPTADFDQHHAELAQEKIAVLRLAREKLLPSMLPNLEGIEQPRFEVLSEADSANRSR
jgi:hypothetical protein